jgi:YegS/Rv2252/BmrU family lipid kinase
MAYSGVHVVLNPTSGGGRARRRAAELLSELAQRGVDATLHFTQSAGHGVELAHMLATAGARAVVAAGGDGTIHDVANGILRAGSDTALAILPLGTGNDFAKVVPGARTLAGAFDVIASPRVVRYDAGYATWPGGDEFFINAMGTGIDVEVVRQIQKMPRLPGAVKYLLGLFRALAVYTPVALEAVVGTERLRRTIMMMAVGNGVCQGGGFYLTPDAVPHDGRLELCVIDSLPLWKVPAVLPRVLRGTHAGHPAVTMRSIERIRFEALGADPLYFQLDGELREPSQATWLDVEVRKSAINVWAGMEKGT